MAGSDNQWGVSEVLGSVILIAVVSTAIGLAAVSIFSQPTPQKIPSFSSEITTVDHTLYITHTGGDALQKNGMIILGDGVDLTNSFSKLNAGSWTTWAVGDTLIYQVPESQNVPRSVQVLYSAPGSAGAPVTPVTTTTAITTSPTVTTTTGSPPLPVTADFDATPASGYSPLSVQFTDSSTGPVTDWSWSFGDGNSSYAKNPQYIYPDAGSWPVSLTVSNGTGTHTLTKTGYITVSKPVSGTVLLSASKGAYIESGGEVQFRVTGTSSSITVGGNAYPIAQGDTVRIVMEADEYGEIYSSSTMMTTFSFNDVSFYRNGAYVNRGAVSAIQINGYDQYHSTLNLYMPPAAASNTYLRVGGTTLINYEQSSAAVRISGLGSNMNLNPCTPSQVYYNGDASGYQILGPQVTGSTPASGEAGTSVTITNLQGMYFEQGSAPTVKLQRGSSTITATAVNVVSSTQIQCTFNLAGAQTGTWDVVVVNEEGVSGVGSGLFTVTPGPLTASFSYSMPSATIVRLTDTSTGGATTWDWDFGDGTPHSSVQNPPDHTYASGGSYVVSLTVTDGSQSSSTRQTIPVFLPATHTTTLNAGKDAYVELGGVVQFVVTGLYSSITVNGVSYSLSPGDTVKLVMGSNGYGSITSSSTMITTFGFNDVSLTINNEYRNRGPVSSIYINGYNQYQSTLNLYMPSTSGWTSFVYDGTTLISGTSSSAVRITGLSGSMNLASNSGTVYYVGSATGYSMT